MKLQFGRRRFLNYLLLTAALVRCKKDPELTTSTKTTPSTPPKTTGSLSPPNIDQYLAEYSITEIGTETMPIDPAWNQTINGYNNQISYNAGDTVDVFLSGPANANTSIRLFDTQGNVAFETSTAINPQVIKSQKPWVEGFMYEKTFSFKIPSNFKSGIYTWNKKIPLIVRSNNKTVDITVVYPSNTVNAYNYAGGRSLYAPDGDNRSMVVSFLRSHTIWYQKFYEWLDEQVYSINYVADSDLDDYNEIAQSSMVVIAGHSEYWTRQARQNIDAFIQSGRNVIILSGNTMWWQVRYAPQQNLMICYKGNPADPLSGTEYNTINWPQKSLNYPVYPSIGVDYTQGGFGQTLPDRWDGYKIVNDKSPILAGTSLKNGDMLHIKSTEYDCIPVVKMIPQDSTEIPAIDYHKLKCYKAELIGYDFAQNLVHGAYKQQGLGTFVVYQQTNKTGTVVNTATMDWCWNIIYDEFKVMTKNMIDLSLSGKSLFAPAF
jgi:hypothetical protein